MGVKQNPTPAHHSGEVGVLEKDARVSSTPTTPRPLTRASADTLHAVVFVGHEITKLQVGPTGGVRGPSTATTSESLQEY